VRIPVPCPTGQANQSSRRQSSRWLASVARGR
jgi:hypothetical protein